MNRIYERIIEYCAQCPYYYAEDRYLICNKSERILQKRNYGEKRIYKPIQPPDWCELKEITS